LIEVTPKIDEVMGPVFGPVAAEGYDRMKDYSDEDATVILEFLEMSREFLRRHTDRVHALIAERDAAAESAKVKAS
jgi:hypothetical protein